MARGMREGLGTWLSLKGGQRNSKGWAKIDLGQCQATGHSARAAALILTCCSRAVQLREATMKSCCNQPPPELRLRSPEDPGMSHRPPADPQPDLPQLLVHCPPAASHLFLHQLTPLEVLLASAAVPGPELLSGVPFSDPRLCPALLGACPGCASRASPGASCMWGQEGSAQAGL